MTAGMITEDPAEAASTPTVTTSGWAAAGLLGQRTHPHPAGMTVPDFDHYNLIYFNYNLLNIIFFIFCNALMC